MFEGEAIAGPRKVGTYQTVSWNRGALEKHMFYSNVVVKPFEVTQPGRRACDMEMQSRRAMSGKVDMKGLTQGCDLQKCGYTATAG
jgi:hypothetical protein